jgi:hypothetical protein
VEDLRGDTGNFNAFPLDDDVITNARFVIRIAHRLRFIVDGILPIVRPYLDPAENQAANDAYRSLIFETQMLVDLMQLHTGVVYSFILSLVS